MLKILIADDEEKYICLLKELLEDEGFEVITAKDGEQAYALFFETHNISLLILDIMMPRLNGYEVCTKIRKESDVPILMLTALSDYDNEVAGLLKGANDYVKKPFHIDVLVARVKNLLKDKLQQQVVIDDIVINKKNMNVYKTGVLVDLSPKEYALLVYLIDNSNITVSRTQILDSVWGRDFFGDPRTVDTHIKNLRTKLPIIGKRIRTKRGVGYLLEVGNDEIY